jgi:hypothetical protein
MDPKELRGLYEAYAEVYAPQQINEISQKTATSAYAKRRTGEFEGDDASDRVAKTNKLKDRIEKKFGKEAGKHADRAADVETFGRKDASGRRKQSPQPRIQTSDHENQREFKRELRIKRDRRLRAARGGDTNEQVNIFDTVLEFLQAEGYVETLEEAEWLMANMIDEEAIDIILEITGGKGHPGYKAGSKDHGPMQSGHPADSEKRKDKGGTMSQRHGYHLGDIDDDDDDEDELESVVKQQSRDSRERVRKPLRNKVKAARKVLSKEEFVDEAQHARENPEKYEREQSKKSAPVRGERTPMPPRGDKRREDFEKWYAKQMGR